jgi:hypothetical protein
MRVYAAQVVCGGNQVESQNFKVGVYQTYCAKASAFDPTFFVVYASRKSASRRTKMKATKLILLTLALLFTQVSPALAEVSQLADNANLQIQNKTGGEVRLTLTGASSQTVTLPTGKTTLSVAQGRYTYAYTACGETVTGSVNVKKSGASLTLPKCKAGGSTGSATKTVTLLIHNKTDAALTFTFVGPKTYYVTAPVGKTRVTMEKGRYEWTMSSYACGSYGTDSGSINLNRSLSWTWRCN